ncbi:MAG: CinA family nicotinamide mononucleotide deamidase-related protein [Myxococcales bacterium]|nr:CinA family nicotinamide mononucleotide deamidase-related protein [Myxococcales bacterium]
MRIETLCTGDELLTGLISDTNSRHFQTRLLERCGLTVARGVVVGDVREELVEALAAAAARCDVVLVSGGLGPTSDDLTAECAARAAGVPLVQSAEALAHLEERFRLRGLTLTDNNRRQALVPESAEVVLNPEGSAPMFIQRRGRCTLFFVPGVPAEYRHLVDTQVVPRVAALAKPPSVRVLKVLKTVGLPESHLDARVRPLGEKYPALTLGFRTHLPENHLKLLVEAPTAAQARATLQQVETEARALLGAHVFGADEETLPGVVLAALKARRQWLAVAESCTGGLVCELLTSVPGASQALYGGAVTYANAAKTTWAGVPEGMVAQFGAVSEEVAAALASGIRAAAGVAWGLAVTGIAGPGGGSEAKPVGTVFVGVAGPPGVAVQQHRFLGDRERVRRFSAHAALDALRLALPG